MSAKFQAGDIVEVIDATSCALGFEFIRNGLRGTVISFYGQSPCSHPLVFADFWECEFLGREVIAAEQCLRKVPPDPGREVMEWDYQELLSKQPECVQ